MTQTKKLRLALDAMGGDDAPACVIQGADIARGENPHFDMVFYGDRSRIEPLLKRTRYLGNAEIVHTSDAVDAVDTVDATAIQKIRVVNSIE